MLMVQYFEQYTVYTEIRKSVKYVNLVSFDEYNTFLHFYTTFELYCGKLEVEHLFDFLSRHM